MVHRDCSRDDDLPVGDALIFELGARPPHPGHLSVSKSRLVHKVGLNSLVRCRRHLEWVPLSILKTERAYDQML